MNRYLIAAVLIAVGVYVAMWISAKPVMPPGVHLPATPAKELRGVNTEPLIIDFVKVYPPKVKKQLKLPADVQADERKHVVASTKTTNDERQHTVTTLLDKTTGEFTTYDRVEPLPWVAVSTRRHYGAYIGAMNGEQALAVTARQEMLRVKALKVEAVAIGLLSQSEQVVFAGVGASW